MVGQRSHKDDFTVQSDKTPSSYMREPQPVTEREVEGMRFHMVDATTKDLSTPSMHLDLTQG